ncbi:MAG: M20/M25/M40 family metallo-hydrolase, partial [Acidobacteriota bacterium]|nr:M20/M25/M40 family metallo-hydrolase [Acidobacteriota bacterium]
MNDDRTREFVEKAWDESVLPALTDYVRIPAQSPAFDEKWQDNGDLDRAAELAAVWAREQAIPGLTAEIVRLPQRTPLLFIEIPGASDRTILMYGHLDKQPPVDGWDEGLGPFSPVIRDGKLYGRGSADDGYAVFSSLTAVRALAEQGIPHARCVGLIECCEESGSFDLPHYMDALKDRIGSPEMVLCLDSGCGNFEQLWITNSLRGMAAGTLTISMLTEGVHSGDASGVVPSTFRILRLLLDRLEDPATGEMRPEAFHVDVPSERAAQAGVAAAVLGSALYDKFPFVGGAQPVSNDPTELLLNKTWRPQMEITGAAGLPAPDRAGNVLRPTTSVVVSVRLPPTADATRAAADLKTVLEADPPFGATVRFDAAAPASGWNAPTFDTWLEQSAAAASRTFFGKEVCYIGEGGSIPLMAMLSEMFPEAGFLITGVLGPKSNAHGPNEFLHLPFVKGL